MASEKHKHGKPQSGAEKFTPERINSFSSIHHESPIDISFSILKRISLAPLEWNNEYEPPRLMKLTNTGDSVILSAKWFGPRPYLCKGPLIGHYVFSQMHFHWGPTDIGGSEHTFDGVRMPLEVHVMFFKSEYLCQESAMKQNDGILCMAFLTELQEEDNSVFKPIVSSLHRIGNAGSSRHIDLLPLTYFFQPFSDDYFMYWGTVVNVHNILWIICRKSLPISASQLNLFRFIRNHNQEVIKSNYRPIKALQNRMVFHVNPQAGTGDTLIISTNKVTKQAKQEKKNKTKKKLKLSDYSRQRIKSVMNVETCCCKANPSYDTYEDSSEDSESEKPTIKASDIEESSLTMLYNKLLDGTSPKELKIKLSKLSMASGKNVSAPAETDSLIEITGLDELKQAEGETYQLYLNRVEEYLKTVMEKIESKKMKIANKNNTPATGKQISPATLVNRNDYNEIFETGTDALAEPNRVTNTNISTSETLKPTTTDFSLDIIKDNIESTVNNDCNKVSQEPLKLIEEEKSDKKSNFLDTNENISTEHESPTIKPINVFENEEMIVKNNTQILRPNLNLLNNDWKEIVGKVTEETIKVSEKIENAQKQKEGYIRRNIISNKKEGITSKNKSSNLIPNFKLPTQERFGKETIGKITGKTIKASKSKESTQKIYEQNMNKKKEILQKKSSQIFKQNINSSNNNKETFEKDVEERVEIYESKGIVEKEILFGKTSTTVQPNYKLCKDEWVGTVENVCTETEKSWTTKDDERDNNEKIEKTVAIETSSSDFQLDSTEYNKLEVYENKSFKEIAVLTDAEEYIDKREETFTSNSEPNLELPKHNLMASVEITQEGVEEEEKNVKKRPKSAGRSVHFDVNEDNLLPTNTSQNFVERKAHSEHHFNALWSEHVHRNKSSESTKGIVPNTAPTIQSSKGVIQDSLNEMLERSKKTTEKLLKQRKPHIKSTLVTEVFTNSKSSVLERPKSVKSKIPCRFQDVNRPAWKY